MWHVNLAPVCLLYIWVRFKRISVCDSVFVKRLQRLNGQ